MFCLSLFLVAVTFLETQAWTFDSLPRRRQQVQATVPVINTPRLASPSSELSIDHLSSSRRTLLSNGMAAALTTATSLVAPMLQPAAALATTISDATITDRIFLGISGLADADRPTPNSSTASTTTESRLVIGLFGNEAPDATRKLKQLVSRSGLAIACRPRAVRDLQREQLQANSVYNRCIESESLGVVLKDSTVWRILPNNRVDIGAVSGKFLSREYPDWTDQNDLKHNGVGVVSVRRGNQGGFGITVSLSESSNAELDDLNVVVGRVVEGMDVLQALNKVPVVKAAKVNYMALTGGSPNKDAPSRSCTYGGPLYCNENKPLIKLTISETGVL